MNFIGANIVGILRFAVLVVLALVLARIVEKILFIIVRVVLPRFDITVDKSILHVVKQPLYISIVLFGVYIGIPEIGLQNSVQLKIQNVIATVLFAVVSYLIYRIGKKIIFFPTRSPLSDKIRPIIENIFKASVIVLYIIGVFRLWGISITPILASAGIIGIAAGLASRDAIANFIGGLSLYFDETYKIGEYIEIGNDFSGFVTDVSIRSTTLRTRDYSKITIPNSKMNSSAITNKSSPGNRIRFSTTVSIDYDENPEYVKKVLKQALVNLDSIKNSPPPEVHLEEFGDSGIVYTVYCWTNNPRYIPNAKDEVNTAIYKKLQSKNISIPYPHRKILDNRSNRKS